MSRRSASENPGDAVRPRDLSRSLTIALLRAREAVLVRFRPMLHAQDITEQQFRVVRILGEESPLDATELAQKACMLAPSLTRIIRALDDRGLISRSKDAMDGRRSLLSIAPAGIALIHAVTPETRAIYDDFERRFGRDKIEHLLDVLNELAATKF